MFRVIVFCIISIMAVPSLKYSFHIKSFTWLGSTVNPSHGWNQDSLLPVFILRLCTINTDEDSTCCIILILEIFILILVVFLFENFVPHQLFSESWTFVKPINRA